MGKRLLLERALVLSVELRARAQSLGGPELQGGDLPLKGILMGGVNVMRRRET
jgi:hypothetical protein